jgi:RNA polymerase sigma-70 factor (ECF subfamily)
MIEKDSVRSLVEEHYEAVYRFAFRLSGSEAEALDLTQESFCRAQQSIAQLRDPNRGRSWLFTIVRNLYLQQKRQRVKVEVGLEHVPEPAEPVVVDPWMSIDQHRLQQALNQLPEAYRIVVILHYFEDFSYRDITEQLGIPIGTVMSRLCRARTHLRNQLQTPALAWEVE